MDEKSKRAIENFHEEIAERFEYSPEKYHEANHRWSEWRQRLLDHIADASEQDESGDKIRRKLRFLADIVTDKIPNFPGRDYFMIRDNYLSGKISTDEFLQNVDRICSISIEDIRQWVKENYERLKKEGLKNYGDLEDWF